MDYIGNAISLLSLVSIDNIKQLKEFIKLRSVQTLDIWGNYDAFLDSQDNPQSDLSTYIWICGNEDKKIQYDAYKDLGISIFIIGKIGYFKIIKEYIKFIYNFIIKRKDLNIFTRFYFAILKARIKIHRIRFYIEIDKYYKNQASYNNTIYKAFRDKIIDRLYLYKFENKESS